jgi:hypothetical protein
MSRFHAVYDKLNQALEGMPYDELGISVEVKEQVNSSIFFFFFFFLVRSTGFRGKDFHNVGDM